MKRILMATFVAAAFSATGCVESDPSILTTAHVFAECEVSENGTVAISAVDITDEYLFQSILNIDLAAVANGAQLVAAGTDEDTPSVFQGRPIFGINFGAQSQLLDSTEYTAIGYDEELRVNQNQFQLETIEFEVIDSPAPYTLSDVPLTALANSSGSVFVSSVPMLGPLQVQQWSSITSNVTNGDANSIVPVTIEAKMVGSLVDGTSAESNVVQLEALVCNGCGFRTTEICGASQ